MNNFHILQYSLHSLEIYVNMYVVYHFPGSSAGKESACNAGDTSWIPGLGRSAGEGSGYPTQYSA